MRRLPLLLIAAVVLIAASASAATGKVIKVLPHYLDLKGRHALSPSLYDRDAYQAQLRANPTTRSALRFDVKLRVRGGVYGKLLLRVEMRGIATGNLPRQAIIGQELKSADPGWTSITLKGEEYKKLGEVTAWRVTLWEGDQMIGEQKSFLW